MGMELIDDRLYSIRDAATFLGGVSERTVTAWYSQGRLKPTKLGRRVFLRKSELERFIAAGSAESERKAAPGPKRGGQLFAA